jgi:hypothetical protein
MKIGDIVVPKNSKGMLYCSHYIYSYAIIKSVDPFILVSKLGDITWYKLNPKDYIRKEIQ